MASGAEHIDFFGVLSKSRDEIVLGEDDRHLDFRALLLIPPRRDGEGAEPRRVCWRLQALRGWSDEQANNEQIFPRGKVPRGPYGFRSPG
jgi:hypothetical protein